MINASFWLNKNATENAVLNYTACSLNIKEPLL